LIDTLKATVPVDASTIAPLHGLFARRAVPTHDPGLTWRCSWHIGANQGRPYHTYKAECGGLHLMISMSRRQADIGIDSLPKAIYGHNAYLLTPDGCLQAIHEVDRRMAPFGVPPLIAWQVSEVHFSHDFLVDPRHLDDYFSSFESRQVRQRGPRRDVVRHHPGTLTWPLGKYTADIQIYDKYDQLRPALKPLVPEGTLRLEVRLRSRGLRALARALGRCRPLTVADVLSPWVAYAALVDYTKRLDLDREIDADGAVERIVAAYRDRDHRDALLIVYHALCSGASARHVESVLGYRGLKDPAGALSRYTWELRDLGAVPGVPGLKLPGLVLPPFEQFSGQSEEPLAPEALSACAEPVPEEQEDVASLSRVLVAVG